MEDLTDKLATRLRASKKGAAVVPPEMPSPAMQERVRIRDYRIGVANLALDTFIPGVMLYHSRELRMSWDNRRHPVRHDFPARLNGQGSWPEFGYRQRPTGGTGMQALAQLIRYVRDLPRLPMATWEYWSGDKVKLATPRTVELLNHGNYGDPEKTKCVLCGSAEFERGLDWWSLDGVTGPCCYGGLCKPSGDRPDSAPAQTSGGVANPK